MKDHKTILLSFFTLFLIFSTEAFAQNLNARDVLDDYFNAIGNRDSVLKIRELHTIRVGDTKNFTLTLDSKFSYPNLKRIEAKVDTLLISQFIFDGEKAFSQSTIGSENFTQDELMEFKEQSSPFIELDLQGSAVYKGQTTFKNIDVHMVQLTQTTMSYYDVNTGLKIYTASEKTLNDQRVNQETEYFEYRAFSGIKFPMKMVVTSGGQQIIYELTFVEFN
ncbi:hypothetical protein N9L20_05125 [Flavobacteriaceae bacterium]|nr:hypothetical protein [Flavobacteriaceae bacterium]